MSKANNKIRIIDLLNKIVNGEDLPTKIQYGYDNDNCPAIWRLNTSLKDYCCDERDSGDNYLFRNYIGDITVVLENEVEILEDNTEEIEELIVSDEGFIKAENGCWKGRKLDVAFANKINEIIRYIKRKDKNND